MKFYKKWKTEIGTPIEVLNPSNTGECVGIFVDSKTDIYYQGLIYVDNDTGERYIKRREIKNADFKLDRPNIIDHVANFHTDSFEAYQNGKYFVDTNINQKRLKKRMVLHIKKLAFLKKHKSLGAKLLLDFYNSICKMQNKNISSDQKPWSLYHNDTCWSRWKNWCLENKEESERLKEEMRNHLKES
jgi:hypothetical protein